MELPYVVILTIISILLTLLYSYKDPNQLQSQNKCIDSICVSYPQLQQSNVTNAFNKYTQVSHTQKFYILSTYNYFIDKSWLRDAVQIVEVGQNEGLMLNKQMKIQLQNITYKFQAAQQVSMVSGRQYHAIIFGVDDYLVFYGANSYKYPAIYVQNQGNANKLMSLTRSLSWGMLFALVLKVIDSHVGICNAVAHYPFPLVQLFIVSYLIYISYQISTFQYLYVAKLMFLIFLLINLARTSQIIQIFGIFVLFVVIGQQYSFLAHLLWLLYMKKINHKFMKKNLRTKISSIVVIIGLIAEVIVLLSKFNYFTYISYASNIISIVLCLMMFQVEQEFAYPNKKKVNLSRYIVDD